MCDHLIRSCIITHMSNWILQQPCVWLFLSFFECIRNTGLKQIIAISPLLLELSSYTVALMKWGSFYMLLVFMSRGFVRRPFQPPNCSSTRVHFSIQFKYTIAVQVLSLFFSSHLFPSVAIFILNLFFFSSYAMWADSSPIPLMSWSSPLSPLLL